MEKNQTNGFVLTIVVSFADAHEVTSVTLKSAESVSVNWLQKERLWA